MVKRIMENSGGAVSAYNRRDGVSGAVFRLEFPLPKD
jgi:nitrogen fixation/metabolism regulation signal transduction histidine kinase